MVKQRSDREWYLPHQPVINRNKLGKVPSATDGAAQFHGTSFNKSSLTSPDLLQNLIHVLLRFHQHQFAVSADIEGMFLQVGVFDCEQPSLRFFVAGGPHNKCCSVSKHAPYIWGYRIAHVRFLCIATQGPRQHRSVPRSNQCSPKKILHGRLLGFDGVALEGSQMIKRDGPSSPSNWV